MPKGLTVLRIATWPWRYVALGLVLIATFSNALNADEKPSFQVIAHPGVTVTKLPTRFVSDAFLKKVTRWEDGAALQPVDLPSTSKTRILFTEQVLKRSVTAVRGYWQQRIFSGRDVPPPEVESESQAVHFVANRPGAIGYVSTSTELRGVKVITLQ